MDGRNTGPPQKPDLVHEQGRGQRRTINLGTRNGVGSFQFRQASHVTHVSVSLWVTTDEFREVSRMGTFYFEF